MKRIPVLPVVLIIVLMAAFSCKKEYSYEMAAGTLRDSMDGCKPVEIAGYYRKGASLASDSFFVNAEVDITKTGAYTISTNFINGFQFAASGTFQQKGIQKIRLKATGVPLRDTLCVFTCYFDTSSCTFTIKVKTDSIVLPVNAGPIAAPTDTSQLNTWYFTDLTDRTFHSGIVDEISNFTKIAPDINYLNIVGWPGNNKDTIFRILVYLPVAEIVTGTYPITSGVGGENSFGYANNTHLPDVGAQFFYYFYRSNVIKHKDFTFTIISFDALRNVIKVNFEGSSQYTKVYNDFVGKLHQVKGRFYCKLN